MCLCLKVFRLIRSHEGASLCVLNQPLASFWVLLTQYLLCLEKKKKKKRNHANMDLDADYYGKLQSFYAFRSTLDIS